MWAMESLNGIHGAVNLEMAYKVISITDTLTLQIKILNKWYLVWG